MKPVKFLLITILISISLNAQVGIKNIPVLQNTFEWNVYSAEVEDSFNIYIKLPEDYFTSQNSYPVLYLLDGDILFPIAAGALQYLYFEESIPEFIIVGIGYGGLSFSFGNNRSRDYTAAPVDGRPYWGGAPKFLKFIENELIPKLEKEYRVDEEERVLMGHSLGGQFVLYSFFTQPQLFTKYIASSPAIYRLPEYFYELEANSFKRFQNTMNKIWISVGENESSDQYLKPIGSLVERISNRKYKTIDLRYEVISGGGHLTVPSTALSYGLKFLFEN